MPETLRICLDAVDSNGHHYLIHVPFESIRFLSQCCKSCRNALACSGLLSVKVVVMYDGTWRTSLYRA